MIINPLGEHDAVALAAFYNGLTRAAIRTFRPLGEKTSLDACERIIRENVLPRRKRYDLVGRRGPAIVGWAFIADLDREKPYLGLAVAEPMQGQGHARTLLGQLLGWARGHEIEKVYLMVVTDNQRAIRLYERHGFTIYDEEFDEADQLPYYHMVADLKTATPTS
jgi:RimJ/RimL family protein N-acetyltransferase